MKPESQWTIPNFNGMWGIFKNRHPEYWQFDYKVSGGDVIIIYNTQNPGDFRQAGYVWDVGSWHYEMLENHLKNVMGQLVPIINQKGKEMDQDKLNEKAEKDGELFAEVAVAFSPNAAKMPTRLLYAFTSRLGKALGYIDTDSNDAFKTGWMNKIDAYNAANSTNVLLDKPQTYRQTSILDE